MILEDYLEALRAKGYSEQTIILSRVRLEHFFKHYPGPPNQLKPSDLTNYRRCLSWEPGPSGKFYSENTVNQIIGVLRSYFRWCIETGLLKTSPASHLVTRRVPDKERVRLSPSETRKLLMLPNLETALGLRDRAILGIIVELQITPTPLSRLDLNDFQPDTGALLVRARKRSIYTLSAGLQADLNRYIRLGRQGQAQPGETALFLNFKGRRLTPNSFQTMLKDYCERAQVPRPSFSS